MSALIRGFGVLANAMRHPLGRRRPLRTLLRIGSWQIKSRLSRGPHDVAWIGNARLLVERGMTGATGNVYFGLHEVPDMAFMVHLLRPGELLLDIGANIGSYTVLAATTAQARVIAFEPHPRTAASLERNVAHNRLGERVDIRRVALSAAEGEGSLTDGLDAMNYLVVGDPGSRSGDLCQVPLRTLDGEVGEATPTMLKIDVEGHEESVLAGGPGVLAQPGLEAIEIETVTPAIEARILAAGFGEAFYDPFTRTLAERALPLKASNRLFVRDLERARARVRAAPRFRAGGVWL